MTVLGFVILSLGVSFITAGGKRATDYNLHSLINHLILTKSIAYMTSRVTDLVLIVPLTTKLLHLTLFWATTFAW